jgi:hypothetical protein
MLAMLLSLAGKKLSAGYVCDRAGCKVGNGPLARTTSPIRRYFQYSLEHRWPSSWILSPVIIDMNLIKFSILSVLG